MNPQEDKSHDVVVVGAGVIGLACAWRAAQRGMKVVVLDRDQPGSGASRVAAGMLSPVGEASWGEENLLDLNLASMERWPGFAEELAAESGVEVGFRPCGALHVALDRDEASELQRRHRLHLELGLESEWLRSSECRRLEPGLAPPVAGGVHARHEAAADPRLLVPALAAAVKAAGGSIETGVEVTAAEVEAGTIMGVRTADGRRFRAGAVVLAAGCWSGAAEWLPAEARPSVRPVKGEILTLRTRPQRARLRADRRHRAASTLCRAATGAWWSVQRSRSAGSTRRSRPAAFTSCFARPTGRCPTSPRRSWPR